MGKLPTFADEKLLVGIETSDDAAVYKVTDDIAMIQTLDFFTPIVDDPYMFGQIAAANSLSDVYAMGGDAKVALNIVGFPNCLDVKILGEILRGGADKVKEAGAVLVGGHSIQDDEPKYGLSVTGMVHPEKIWKNYGCQKGEVLLLTKPIGNGIINTAIKAEMAQVAEIEEVQNYMAQLNKKAKEIAIDYEVSACTDITGFGMIGHAIEMAGASEVTLEIEVESIPKFSGVMEYAKMGLVPEGAYRNRRFAKGKIDEGSVEDWYKDLLYDPQTSGGLLFSVSEEAGFEMLERYRAVGMADQVAIIGRVKEKGDCFVRLV